MRERWIIRILVDRDPDEDDLPTLWDWGIEGADVQVLSGEVVGIVPGGTP